MRPDIKLTVIAPSRWREYGRDMVVDRAKEEDRLDFRAEKVRLQNLPMVAWYLHHYPGLSKLMKELKPDVIHLWEEPWSAVTLQAMWLRNRFLPRSALVLETEQNVHRRLPPPFERMRAATLRQTDLLIGRQVDALNVSKAAGFRGPTTIVEYGVDRSIFYPHDREGARSALGVKGFVLGYIGRIIPEKGLDDVLSALVKEQTASLCILGAGPDRDHIVKLAVTLGVSNRVSLFEPRAPNEVARFINGLDVLVLMSRTTYKWKEQFGRVIMEAHACGVPVIGSDSGSIPGVIAEGGWTVPERDADALAALVRVLQSDRAKVNRAGAAGLAQAKTRFSIETVANNLADAYINAWQTRNPQC